VKAVFAFAVFLLVSANSRAQSTLPAPLPLPLPAGVQSETVYTCADKSGRVEVQIRHQRGQWTEGSGEQTSQILQRYLTAVKVDGKIASMLSAACHGSWRARAALCSAQVGTVRYDLFRGISFPLEISAVVWVGNQSSSLKISCKQEE
jgi:hypothetical protein